MMIYQRIRECNFSFHLPCMHKYSCLWGADLWWVFLSHKSYVLSFIIKHWDHSSHKHTHTHTHTQLLARLLQFLMVCGAGFLRTQGRTHDLWGTPSVWRYVFCLLESLMKLCFPPLEDQNVSDLTKEETTHIFLPLSSFSFFLHCGKNT